MTTESNLEDFLASLQEHLIFFVEVLHRILYATFSMLLR